MSPPRSTLSRLGGPVVAPTAPSPLRSPVPGFSSSLQDIESAFRVLPDFYAEEDPIPRLLQGYFRDVRLQAALKFGKTTLAVENSPDLHLREGAGICAEARVHEGRLSFPQPLRLGGFYALGGLYEFCSVDTDAAGKLRLQSCGCSLPKNSDITDAALADGPLARLFPEKRLHPVSLSDLISSLKSPASAGPPQDDALLDALHFIQVKAQVPNGLWIDDPPGTPGGSCHPQMASLEAYLDVPELRRNFTQGLWRSFDFRGVERGSKLLWPRFDLSALPLPDSWSIVEGRADLELRHFPDEGSTEIRARELHARVKIPALFGSAELGLQGGLTILLKRGGEIEMRLEDLRVEAPFGSAPNSLLPNFSALLSGKLSATKSGESFELSGLQLALDDLQWHRPEESTGDFSWSGTLLGQGALEFDGEKKRWNRLEMELSGDMALRNGKERPLLKLEGVGLELRGDEERLRLDGDALSLQYGEFAMRPSISVEIQPRREADAWRVEGRGRVAVTGTHFPLSLQADANFDAGPDTGRAELQAIRLNLAGESWTKQGRLETRWDEKGWRARFRLPDLPGGSELRLDLKPLEKSERLAGNFQLRPPKLALGPGLTAEDLRWSGSFVTEEWSTLPTKPKLSLNTRVSGRLRGAGNGPFDAELQGALSYSPARRSIFLWLNPRRRSVLRFGPLSLAGESGGLEGELPLKGTWQAVLLPRGFLIGGRGVGVEGGELRFDDGSSRRKVIENFDLIADQLWSVQNGIAYAGGDGIRLEASLEPSAWVGPGVTGLGKRKIFLVTDRLPLSLEAYWRLFAKSLQEEGR